MALDRLVLYYVRDRYAAGGYLACHEAEVVPDEFPRGEYTLGVSMGCCVAGWDTNHCKVGLLPVIIAELV